MKKRKLKLKIKKLKATFQFSLKLAKRLTKKEYYVAQSDYIKKLPQYIKEKSKYAVERKTHVSKLIAEYKQSLYSKSEGVWGILSGIYRKNRSYAKQKQNCKNSDLMHLVSSVPMLITSYATIKGNKGAMTLAAQMSKEKFGKLSFDQKMFIKRTSKCPDGISMELFQVTSKLLKNGNYPWGTSRRIYIDKPGQPGVLRPITIPPFMDRIVQESIRRVLESIYEPYFEHMNKSFGFRPAKGAHDCIYALSRGACNGFTTAIEGDIKSAYDKVCQQTLLSILEKRIQDRKFLNLLKQRLDYQYFDTKENKHFNVDTGIPQGGIDSPYLWNIYMLEFDEHVVSYMDELIEKTNKKLRKSLSPKQTVKSKERESLVWSRDKEKKTIKLIYWELKGKGTSLMNEKKKKNLYKQFDLPTDRNPTEQELKTKIKKLIRSVRIKTHRLRKMEGTDPNKKSLRYAFCRYADDWIITGNFPLMMGKRIKLDLSKWLQENLKATLSIEKTLLTDMRKQPAHFLGFEIRARTSRKINYAPQSIKRTGKPIETKLILRKTGGYNMVVSPDKNRLINRLFMKGYCDKNGFPREIPWLSTLESFAIIERYNSVLRGTANYYLGFISKKADIYRWLYIIRFSCYKTLAQKYKTSISQIFKRFKSPGLRTIQISVTHDFGETRYRKTWKLLTDSQLIKNPLHNERFNIIRDRYETIESNPDYESQIKYEWKNGGTPRVIHFDFLEKIHWVNLRSSAPLDLPCFICGSTNKVEMHHINHVRKRKFSQIPEKKFWEKIMALRNRKQIPFFFFF